MYYIYIDSWRGYKYVFNPNNEKYNVIDASMDLNMGESDTLSFTIAPDHPYYDIFSLYHYEDGDEAHNPIDFINNIYVDDLEENSQERLARFRVYNIKVNNDLTKTIECEGIMSMFNDVILLPRTIQGDSSKTGIEYVRSFLSDALNNSADSSPSVYSQLYNEYRGEMEGVNFLLTGASIEITDSNNNIVRYLEEEHTFQEFLKNSVCGSSLGGYIRCRPYGHEFVWIDYLSNEPTRTSSQKIQIGKNLLSMDIDYNMDDYYNWLLPIGKNSAGDKIYINDNVSTLSGYERQGKFIRNINGIAFGNKVGIYEYDEKPDDLNITTYRQRMVNSAEKQMSLSSPIRTINLSAVDMAMINADESAIEVGQNVIVDAKPFLNESITMVVKQKHIDFVNPANNILKLGKSQKTLTKIVNNK